MEPDLKQEDTHSYNGWLNSDSFLKRMLGIFFYNILAGIVVYLGIILIGILVGGSFLINN